MKFLSSVKGVVSGGKLQKPQWREFRVVASTMDEVRARWNRERFHTPQGAKIKSKMIPLPGNCTCAELLQLVSDNAFHWNLLKNI